MQLFVLEVERDVSHSAHVRGGTAKWTLDASLNNENLLNLLRQ